MIQVMNPFFQREIKTLEFASIEEIKSKKSLLSSAKPWPLYQRIESFKLFLQKVQKARKDLIANSIQEGGKPLKDTIVEWERACSGIELCIHEMHNAHGREVPMGMTNGSQNHKAYTRLEPMGIVLAISAFNHPINLFIHQVLPALAVGCPVLYKPALSTPSVSEKMVRMLHDCGVPAEYLQYILVSNETVSELVASPEFSVLNFIGSAEVGWKLRSLAFPGTRVLLEHGGLAPALLDEGLQIAEVVPSLVKAAFYHSGQVCVSLQRLFVPKSELEAWKNALKEAVGAMVLGNPNYPRTDIGPMVASHHLDRVENLVQDALTEGADLVYGAVRDDPFYSPTILSSIPDQAKLNTEEAFGPVLCLYTYEDWNSALEQINQTPFSFQASVYSDSLQKVEQAVSEIKAATVLVNEHPAFRVDWMPFGGHDQSGLGMGGISTAMKEYQREKLVIVKS